MLTEQTRRSGSDSRGLMAVNPCCRPHNGFADGKFVAATGNRFGSWWRWRLARFSYGVYNHRADDCSDDLRMARLRAGEPRDDAESDGTDQLDNDWRVPVLPIYHLGLGSGWSLCGS